MKFIFTKTMFAHISRPNPVLTRCALPALLVASLALAGCQPAKPGSGGEAYTTEQALVQRANDLLRKAADANPQQKQVLLLAASEQLAQAEQFANAQQLLQQLDQQQLTLKPLARYSLLSAELALQQDNFFAARHHLTNPALERMWRDLPVELKQRWHRHRAYIFAILGEEKRSAEEYVALSGSSSDGDEITKIHQQLWQLLTRIPQQTLLELTAAEQQKVLRGWYLLAQISRSNQGDIEGLQTVIDHWQRDWSWHPGTLYPPAGLDDIREIANQLPQRLALLLPLNGKYKNAGKAIQNGFMAAYYQVLEKGSKPPVIQIYDSSADPDIQALYQQAIDEGAEMVIGPLLKENIAQLNEMGALPVPTVSLSYLLDTSTPIASNLLQFGQSATNEARQAANRAWLEGHRRALAITRNTNAGKRTLAAFKEEWESLGGELVSTLNYEKKQVDFKEDIKAALLINHSEQRGKRLADVLGNGRIKSAPRHRRQDIDMVFLFAFSEQGRLIKPALDLVHADDLPVYATSQIYNGHSAPSKDRDLDNVKFSAMPWTLPGTIAENMIPDTKSLATLFALGLDAYKIHQAALQMQLLPETQLFGSTGTLTLHGNEIKRLQPWAEFRRGKVRKAHLPKIESPKTQSPEIQLPKTAPPKNES